MAKFGRFLKKLQKKVVSNLQKCDSGTLNFPKFAGKVLCRLGMIFGISKFPEILSQWPFLGQKKTVSWGLVQRKPKIGPLLGRSFEKWFAV